MQPIVFLLIFILPLVIQGADIPRADLISLPTLAAVFAAPFVVVVGIPSLLLLRHFNLLSWVKLGAVGFAAAAIPFAALGWSDSPGSSSGGNWYGHPVEFVVNGQRSIYGWLSYAQSIVFYGLHGFVGALVFFFVWYRWSGPNHRIERTRVR